MVISKKVRLVRNMIRCGLHLVALLCTIQVAIGLNPDVVLQRSITKHGYEAELHKVVTEDGFILSMSRVPGLGKPPMLIMHGLLGCSADYTVQGPQKSLAFLAADSGYDVWLGNNRGTTFSKNHSTLDPKSKQFWDFSFHELGVYDLPAMVNYILQATNSEKLHYVGHSQGTTQFFVLTSSRPEYNEKFSSVHLSAPVAFLDHATTPAIYLVNRVDELMAASQLMQIYNLFGRGHPKSYMDTIAFASRTGYLPPGLILTNIWYFIGYHDSINRTLLPDILETTPAGASVLQLLHYIQIYNAKRFQQFDYGPEENLRRYNSTIPPEYPLHRITTPIHLYTSDYDNFNQPQDVDQLTRRLPNVALKFKVPVARWNHLDFFFDVDAHHLYRVMLGAMAKLN
ncbi:lysosomal acid lipase [Culex quinquefasciatus]|uniref:Lipase n=1 Tax=Culex quinquefasciatus TaxID=7176 RepID=B0W004_CULQU|nr:lysosomal acid lipase [Culex quinquefasciatus]|eukprot:XP_001842038.1 lysosomal acid lipase [Culex quinquefasciatus]